MSQRYFQSLFDLMPRGLFSQGSKNLQKLLRAMAGEFQLAEDFIRQRYQNQFPQYSDEEFLEKWGRLTRQGGSSFEALRGRVIRQLQKSGGATVESFQSHLRQFGIEDDAAGRIKRVTAPNAFQIRLPAAKEKSINCQSACNEPILILVDIKVITDYLTGSAPAHVTVSFIFDPS